MDRINTIVSNLLIVGKPTIAADETNHLNEILKEIIPLIESEAHMYNVQLHMKMTAEPVFIKVSKDHFKQIVLNLVKNALEAMEAGGGLYITSDCHYEKKWDRARALRMQTNNGKLWRADANRE